MLDSILSLVNDILWGKWQLLIILLVIAGVWFTGGSSATLTQVLAAADMSLGLMTVVNIIALFLLSPTIISVTKHYSKQLKSEKSVVIFKQNDCDIRGKIESDAWR